ncbi:MAG: RluA family pseudouridine synthase [Bacillota bacterium]|nr:RluA family pseudouridine synthase [Bacillota bacterium]
MNNGDLTPAELTLSVDEVWSGKRIDLFLAEQVDQLSRSRAQKLIENELVTVNGITCRDKNYRLQAGEMISYILPTPEEMVANPENIELDIIYEDKDLLVINKERGMVVHPAPGHTGGTLVNALLNHCDDLSGIGGVIRPGIVHRLDKDTSGLLIVAKNDTAHNSLSDQLKDRTLRREYIALVCGRVKSARGKIEAPIGRHPKDRKKMAVVSGGREAVTRYRVIRNYDNYSLLRLKLETGRTHQIRVHMANLGYPVVGDPIYGPGSYGDLPDQYTQPQALHAQKISFIHPRTGTNMEFTAPFPSAFRETLHWLKTHKNA